MGVYRDHHLEDFAESRFKLADHPCRKRLVYWRILLPKAGQFFNIKCIHYREKR
jgi:hypothetical protein